MTYLFMIAGKKTSTVLLLLLTFFVSTKATCQSTTTIPFETAVYQLEQAFNVKFSYNSSKAKTIAIDKPDVSISLSEILETITTTTQITFTAIDSRYITVVFPEKFISICASIIDTATGAPASDVSILYNNETEELNKYSKFTLENILDSTPIEIYRNGAYLKTVTAKSLIKDNLTGF